MVLLMELGQRSAFDHAYEVHRKLHGSSPQALLQALHGLVGISRDIIGGLVELHAARILHSDIKPDNCIIMGGGRAKVADLSNSMCLPEHVNYTAGVPGARAASRRPHHHGPP